MKLSSLCELLAEQIKDLHSAETQLVKALPKIVKGASSDALKEAIESHLEETRGHVERLEKIGEILDFKVTGQKCKGMQGLLEEGDEALKATGSEAVIDAAIVAAAQRVEHYEIAAYGSARTMAELLGKTDVVALLDETLEEEKAADSKLTSIVEKEIYPEISGSDEDDSSEHDGMAAAGHESSRGKRSSR
jgi:ferritin-like metal-binding protein YciE